jgi:hypothetical protein
MGDWGRADQHTLVNRPAQRTEFAWVSIQWSSLNGGGKGQWGGAYSDVGYLQKGDEN